MIVKFFDREDEANDLNGAIIRDNARLRQILQSLQDRSPFFCELVCENGFRLLIGVGKVGCAEYARCDGNPPYLVAVADKIAAPHDYEEFLTGGTLTPVSKRFCLPFDAVMDLAVYFQETGAACPLVSWEEV